MSDWPLVSAVIIGRNEGARLTRCIESVIAAGGEGYDLEIIYVDSASSDDSVARARGLGASVLEVRPERPSAALGLNAGWRHAAGEYVLFLDGDTILQPQFVSRALAAMAAPRVVAVWGHRRELAPLQSVYVRVLDLDWVFAPGDTLFCGGDVLMRRAALAAVDGFDDTLIAGEEPELCARLRAAGGAIRHIDAPMTLHDLAIASFKPYWRRAFRAGYAYAEVSERCRATPARLWSREAGRNLVHGGLIAIAPLLLAASWIVHPALTLGAAAAGMALLARSVRNCAWKSPHAVTRVLYALHSHFQQLPILCGQLAYRLDRTLRRRRRLIEYKGVAT